MRWIVEQIRLLLVAWQFFTRVPVGTRAEGWMAWTPERLRASSRYFPLVGFIVGVAGAVTFYVASSVFSSAIAAVLALSTTALLTGGFHEDGFADYFDSFGANGDRSKALAIMKDSRIGSFGALALLLLTVLKVAALSQSAVAAALIALVCAHTLGRAGACVLMASLDYVRDGDAAKAKPLAEKMTRSEIVCAVGIGVTPLLLTSIWCPYLAGAAAIAMLTTVVFIAWFHNHLKRRLGGFTGDTLGAAEQTIEALVLLDFAARLA
jgi:adenosylcobinamide-GDP ribazoletransferase